MKLFIDIWGWLTLQDRKENRHREVKSLYEAARQQGSALYTTDYILNEIFTLLFRRLSFPTARESLELFDRAITQGYLQLEQITPERFERAKRLRLKFQDKPKVSFTDFTSMVIMTELHIEEILTEDEHFLQVGMGFRRVP